MDIRRLIEKEQACGHLDSSVFGGFAAYLKDWAEEHALPSIASMAENYATASMQERPAILAHILAELPEGAGDQPLPIAENAPPIQSGEDRRRGILSAPLVRIRNIGEKRAALFRKLGAGTAGELLELYPRDYQDRRHITPIGELRIGEQANIKGTVVSCELQRTANRNMTILRCYLKDESGMIQAIWFNQPFLQKRFYPGREVTVFGSVGVFGRGAGPQITVQDYLLTDSQNPDFPGILPVYGACEGLSQKMIRSAMQAAWQACGAAVTDVIPAPLRQKNELIHRDAALQQIHFPKSMEEIDEARRTLAYEELLAIQTAIMSNRPQAEKRKTRPGKLVSDNEVLSRYLSLLPYSLTEAQERVIGEIYADMNADRPMTRLVQGDVGSGKTAVAAAAIAKCCLNGRQAAMMAPTELLANQHFRNLSRQMDELGISNALLTASTPAAEKKEIYASLKEGRLAFVVGTHALIQESVEFADLGLAITDEQHRFGVAQRARLRGVNDTDTLVMTATPIPRTLAMTIYADMSLSVIDQLPPGRKPVRTYAVDYSYEQRIHAFIKKEVAKGRQAFVVCPLIEDSEVSDLASATGYYERLQKKVFPELTIGLLHGKMKTEEKAEIMGRFRSGEINVLVATTVIEVGIDIPNASIMLIRDAERFGLAQLHQLRGRIGRGSEEGHCILMHNQTGKIAKERLDIMCNCSDGFKLAEADLRLRGPGEFFGKRQHGLPALHIADVFRDHDLLEIAHRDAVEIIEGRINATDELRESVTKKLQAMS